MARSRFPRHSGGPKRLTTWVGPADQGFVAVASATKVIISSFVPAAASSMLMPTIVRTRGGVSIKPAAFTGDAMVIGAYGMAVVSTDAFAAGDAAVPGPFDDADWGGWFVWRSFSFHFEFFGTPTVITFPSSIQHEVDSKAMRKVPDNSTVVIVAESAAGAFDISIPFRQLYKLS